MEFSRLSIPQRERFGFLAVALIFLFLAGGLVKLQVLQHAELAEQSENNRIRVVPIVPRRGLVLDREERVIIDNRPSYAVSIIPAELVEDRTIPELSILLGMDTAMISKRMKRNMVSRYQPALIKKDIPFEVVAVLEEQHDRFPGVSYQMERVRLYQDSLGAEVFTGHVGEVSKEELNRSKRRTLRLGSTIGKKGLEREFDGLLRGIEGTEYIEVFASGQIQGPFEDRKKIAAIPGADLVLTIDNDIQQACVNALDTFCCGAIVAIDPRNGEILALTSYPSYNANIFSSVIPEDLWESITSDTTHPLLNRPLTGQYPPGSLAKFVTVGAGLEEHIVTPTSLLDPCTGGYFFGDRVFHCWDLGGHGRLDAAHALERSCDVYMYQLGLKLGIDVLSKYYDLCGFGKPTGVQLPGEVSGLNPNSTYYDQRYGKKKWTRGLVLNNSIGQGELLATPLQLAQFYCGLAMDGKVYRPHLVKKIISPNGDEQTIEPQLSFRFPFSPSTMAVLKEGLRLVVEGKHGTARSLKNGRYSIGGKTGTAQNPHGDEHSLFCGVAPLEAPEIVVMAIVENAGHGSDVAAPVVGQVIRAYMDKQLGQTVQLIQPQEPTN